MKKHFLTLVIALMSIAAFNLPLAAQEEMMQEPTEEQLRELEDLISQIEAEEQMEEEMPEEMVEEEEVIQTPGEDEMMMEEDMDIDSGMMK